MTHARQKGSLRQSVRTAEWWDNCPLWPHGGTMGDAWPERSLRFGRTKKISEIPQQRKVMAKKVNDKRGRTEKSDQNRKLDRRRDKKRDRKSYPLRGRAGSSDGEGLSCHVLLTRLEESIREQERNNEERVRKDPRRHLSLKPKKGKSSDRKGAKSLPKTKSKSSSPSHSECVHVPQPRKRRLASLNAEAVNSLLLERATDPQAAAKQARRQEEPMNGGMSLDANPTRSVVPGGLKASRGNVSKASTSHKLELCQSSKQVKKAKAKRAESWGMSPESLDAPAPRRLAGLNAAALLKLTSSSATSKQRVKTAPTATVTSDCKAPAAVSTPKQHSRVKLKPKGRSQKQKGKKVSPPHSGCTACKKKADFEPNVDWETCTHRLTKPGYQSRSMLAYPLKQVKEEQLETELSPYYCCPPEGSVEYCHRLAFFLGQQPYGESDDQPLNSAMTPVKRECLVTSPSLTHSHPHTALTLSPHPCLCTADHCFSSYYVHIAHPTHTGTTSANLAPRPLNFAPSSLCPNRMTGSKLLDSRVSHGSGLAHPAFCNSVTSPCYGDACGISGYTYRAMPPVTSRGCSFSTGCTGCTHSIKTEGYSSPQGDHSPSLLVPPSLPISSCPLSSVPSSTQTKPHLLTPLSGRDQPQARLKLATECPQSNEPSNGSLSMGRTRLQPQKQPAPLPTLSSTKQKRVSRRRATNGWRPVGMPTEREVFIAGEDETALRQCYEGVERDGEVIHVRDTVLLRSGPRKKSLPYVAKISALWEDPKTGELMMSLFWYYRPEHTQGGRDPSTHCENEIFASRHQDENSVACIEDRCYVLPLAQYCRYCALVKRRAENAPPGSASMVPCRPDFAPPSHRCVPTDVDPELVYLCRHVYDFRFGRILKNLQ
ncbi:bromo adjacent homology domain-containing 1 protein-like [Centropristis striata]|uniref:bromo adjacent homology domain-containing 1 protein-like n=1 Tax=Centropristis striata TaxID=184440 RepID=UPI0027DF3442|nr:bromo adjacent homology domain-containing 1 protein-like [Centropristis striata]